MVRITLLSRFGFEVISKGEGLCSDGTGSQFIFSNRQLINWMKKGCVILVFTVRIIPRPGTTDPGTSRLSCRDLTESKCPCPHLNNTSSPPPKSFAVSDFPLLWFTLKYCIDRENETDKVIKSQESFSRHCTSN